MAEEIDDSEAIAYDRRFGKAISKGVMLGAPIVVVLLSLGIWILTDNDLPDSIATALLPGTLLGMFAGGFAGMASALE